MGDRARDGGLAAMMVPFALAWSLLATLPTNVGFPLRTRVTPGPDQPARAVARMVGGIISYTRWPGDAAAAMRLCVIGKTRFADRLGEASPVAGRPISVNRLATGNPTIGQSCDILYLGDLPAGQGPRTIAGIRGRAILSIAESDPACRGGTMFCLDIKPLEISFQLSLDAISRGTVRVDPRVLRLSDADGDAS
ncbi:YfiR family protein [Sphingomonas sp. QA11]|uniref:YfiR family protein n=1 Tax=Sphingomonas sp. QA11 TaxID=2950605 RepID=UPI0023495DC8|nr:YfiR family protein [Sphingomonas sp. QA11]WCM28347.1 YfiR family protein [Sphingomonas sp. QA11]